LIKKKKKKKKNKKIKKKKKKKKKIIYNYLNSIQTIYITSTIGPKWSEIISFDNEISNEVIF